VENEENEHPAPEPHTRMINVTNELSDAHKKISQRGNCE
jgi:hypothetical protein